MSKIVRVRFTLDYKQETVRLVEYGRTIRAVARDLVIAAQMVHNWVKLEAAGFFGGGLDQALHRRAGLDPAPEGGVHAGPDGARHLKKSSGIFCLRGAVSYAFTERHKIAWLIIAQCGCLKSAFALPARGKIGAPERPTVRRLRCQSPGAGRLCDRPC